MRTSATESIIDAGVIVKRKRGGILGSGQKWGKRETRRRFTVYFDQERKEIEERQVVSQTSPSSVSE